jgi:hypothetical protein
MTPKIKHPAPKDASHIGVSRFIRFTDMIESGLERLRIEAMYYMLMRNALAESAT